MRVVADGVGMRVYPVSMVSHGMGMVSYSVGMGGYRMRVRADCVRVGRVCMLAGWYESTIPGDFPRPVCEGELVAPYKRVIMICSARPAVVV